MKRIDDMARWTEAALDTPFTHSGERIHGYYPPGVCVMSRERVGGWPRHYGKVVTFDREKDYVLVRSYGSRFDVHGDASEAGTVWEGTVSECLKMWEID